MDRLDRDLLDVVQGGFPVAPAPYEIIAERCGTTAAEAERRVKALREQGIIRRLGAVLNSRGLGMVTTLVASDVDDDAVEAAAACIDGFGEVTHSYLREGRPNLWFALVAASQEAIDRILDEVRALAGVKSVMELPATKLFKLAVKVDTSAKREEDA